MPADTEALRQQLVHDIFTIARAAGTNEASVIAAGLLENGWTR